MVRILDLLKRHATTAGDKHTLEQRRQALGAEGDQGTLQKGFKQAGETFLNYSSRLDELGAEVVARPSHRDPVARASVQDLQTGRRENK